MPGDPGLTVEPRLHNGCDQRRAATEPFICYGIPIAENHLCFSKLANVKLVDITTDKEDMLPDYSPSYRGTVVPRYDRSTTVFFICMYVLLIHTYKNKISKSGYKTHLTR